jgi:hypothetical protein
MYRDTMYDLFMGNESARSFSWLSNSIGIGQTSGPGAAERLWEQTIKEMSDHTQFIVYTQDWLSDFWLARGTRVAGITLGPTWDPPSSLDEWRNGGHAMAAVMNLPGRRTNHAAFTTILAENAIPEAPQDTAALDQFLQWKSEITRDKDVRMTQLEHVRAWLGTSVGHLLMSILLSPPEPSLMLGAANRLQLPLQFELPTAWSNDFEERRLEMLYNWRVAEDGGILQSVVHVGQGEEWREHWNWLSFELDVPETLASVQLAARLMRCPILTTVLVASLGSPNTYLRTASLAVLRRWLLTLKVMTWLEAALARPWEFVRPQDLSCFAFGALKPDWPPRLMAISHRSADVKPSLMQMKLWRSARCAIDAKFVPAWETNTGMMWGLFAAPPLLVRVDSPLYKQSLWCRREIEVIEYLFEQSDFLADRSLIDLPVDRLPELDRVFPAWAAHFGDDMAEGDLALPYPPPCSAWSPELMLEWEVKLYRAAAALRLMNVFLADVALTNQLADKIYGGLDLPGEAPTNNPDGWLAYGATLRDLRSILGNDPPSLPIHLAATYNAEDQAKDIDLAQRIPDLSTGVFRLGDVLVALEWLRTEWPVMVESGSGDFVVLDCKQFTKEVWTEAIELSLHRGLTSIRTSGPLWLLQLAGQDVETWPFIGERPIFTQHLPDQFNWMLQVWFDRQQMRSRYPTDSAMDLSPALVAMCTTESTPQQ